METDWKFAYLKITGTKLDREPKLLTFHKWREDTDRQTDEHKRKGYSLSTGLQGEGVVVEHSCDDVDSDGRFRRLLLSVVLHYQLKKRQKDAGVALEKDQT